eukprot:CAMPEP_0117453950 /NCGR_PEP_ID=MMETSP0759-20121206/10521_1 /TAXON_ID=63605 /ORGANISM="Percolomonas cosmopolitus, Strain WS" /LENGTH=442 /DNA_ID=CAMNT_0005247065 /DNA_START=186 /DNA_END=1511 /DNA_ORIENTATION=+
MALKRRSSFIGACGECHAGRHALYSSSQERTENGGSQQDIIHTTPQGSSLLKSKLKPVSFYMKQAQKFHSENNISRAFRYFMQASVLGHPEAHYQVGNYFLNYFKEETGIGDDFSIQQNFVKMDVEGQEKMCFVDSKTLRKMKMDEKKAKNDEEDAIDREIISEKIMTAPLKESKKMAMTYFKKGAIAPNPHLPSMLVYGKYLIFDQSRDQDFTKGIRLLAQAAEEFDSGEAYFLLGQLFFDGAKLGLKARRLEQQCMTTVEKDVKKAMDLFWRAAELNDANSLYFLGYSTFWGENGESTDKEKARDLLLNSANLDHPEANYFLAMIYLEDNNKEQYKLFLDRAIALKSSNALFVRADQLMRAGELDKALQYYERAANLGSRDASFCTGAIYYRKKKYLEAFEWYSKSAKLGSAQAIEAMLDMVKTGTGVSKDEKYARHLEE